MLCWVWAAVLGLQVLCPRILQLCVHLFLAYLQPSSLAVEAEAFVL